MWFNSRQGLSRPEHVSGPPTDPPLRAIQRPGCHLTITHSCTSRSTKTQMHTYTQTLALKCINSLQRSFTVPIVFKWNQAKEHFMTLECLPAAAKFLHSVSDEKCLVQNTFYQWLACRHVVSFFWYKAGFCLHAPVASFCGIKGTYVCSPRWMEWQIWKHSYVCFIHFGFKSWLSKDLAQANTVCALFN